MFLATIIHLRCHSWLSNLSEQTLYHNNALQERKNVNNFIADLKQAPFNMMDSLNDADDIVFSLVIIDEIFDWPAFSDEEAYMKTNAPLA